MMIKTKTFAHIPMRHLLRWGIGILLLLTLSIYFYESQTIYTYHVYEVGGGYAYQIKKSGKVFIQQDFVPTLENYQPFKEKEHAQKAAKLMVDKLKAKKVPALSAPEINEIIN